MSRADLEYFSTINDKKTKGTHEIVVPSYREISEKILIRDGFVIDRSVKSVVTDFPFNATTKWFPISDNANNFRAHQKERGTLYVMVERITGFNMGQPVNGTPECRKVLKVDGNMIVLDMTLGDQLNFTPRKGAGVFLVVGIEHNIVHKQYQELIDKGDYHEGKGYFTGLKDNKGNYVWI